MSSSPPVLTIDAVVNIRTPEALSYRPGWTDDFFAGKMKAGSTPMAGLELEEVQGSGVRIRRVQPDGPLSRAGVVPGQWVRAACGKPLGSLGDFRDCFGKARPGQRLSIEVSEERDGPSRPIEVDLWGEF